MGLDEAIEAEAQAQAICMQTEDFHRAYEAFVAKQQAGVRGRLMQSPADRSLTDTRYLDWPFFDDAHRALAAGGCDGWAARAARRAGTDHARRRRALPRPGRALGDAGLAAALRAGGLRRRARGARLALALPAARDAGAARRARRLRLRDAGPRQRARSRSPARERAARDWLPRVARGRGDRRVRALGARRRLRRRGDGDDARAATAATGVLDGEKTWISNGGIADFYCVFARTGEAPGARGASRPSSSMPTRRASRSPSAST